MNIMVTGGQGRLGRTVTEALIARGDRVTSVDLHTGSDSLAAGETRRVLDVRDVGALLGATAGCDAVIHCAAIPSPERHAAEVVFETNVIGTFAVLQAAMLAGVSRVAIASSLSALGGAWADPPHPPRYVPVEEAHPLEVEDTYGLSKIANERTAEMFHRRAGMTIAALRFGWILSASEARAEAALFASDPMRNRAGLWSYIDERDAALACLHAIDAPNYGFAVMNIIGHDTLATLPTDEALERFAPEVERRVLFAGFESPFSTDLARRVVVAGNDDEAVEMAVQMKRFTPDVVFVTNSETSDLSTDGVAWLERNDIPVSVGRITGARASAPGVFDAILLDRGP